MITKIFMEMTQEDYIDDIELLLLSFMVLPILVILDIITILFQPIYYLTYKRYKREDDSNE